MVLGLRAARAGSLLRQYRGKTTVASSASRVAAAALERKPESVDGAATAPARRLSQPTSWSHPWLLREGEVTPGLSRADYASRRAALQAALPDGALLLLPAAPQTYMSGDVPYLYRANASLRYLTGASERGATLAVLGGDAGATTLFTAPRDPSAERWDGPQLGAGDDVSAHFGVPVRSAADLPAFIARALADATAVHLDPQGDPQFGKVLYELPGAERARFAQLWQQKTPPQQFVDQLRLVKSPAELRLMRQTCAAVAGALNDAMAQLRAEGPGDCVPERAIEAAIEYSCKRRGADRMAFPCVVAGGANGTVLHYMANAQRARHGDLVMVDAGCELAGYSSDVSRTWPVSGVFSAPQRDLYTLVLDVQKRLLQLTVAGISLDQLHGLAISELSQGLLDLGFFKGESLASVMESGKYLPYYPHATGHFLGMDVHDTHAVPKNIPLRPGMVVTIEPGLYVDPADDSAPEAFRGIGIRIEDDVVITPDGAASEVLSDAAVKEVEDIEELVGSARSKWDVSSSE